MHACRPLSFFFSFYFILNDRVLYRFFIKRKIEEMSGHNTFTTPHHPTMPAKESPIERVKPW
jgi:hypothetical protein